MLPILTQFRLVAILVVLTAANLPASAIAADAAEATHIEAEPIRLELGDDGRIETMAMDAQGNLLVGITWAGAAANRPEGRQAAIKVVASDGKLVDSWPLANRTPSMIHACSDGAVYVADEKAIAILDPKGKTLKTVPFADIMFGFYQGAHPGGLTANEDYVFLAFGNGRSVRATVDVVRFDRKLESPEVLAESLYGCCMHLDLDVKDGVLFVAENSRHRVNRYQLNGEPIDRWGRRDRTNIEGFAACCNPVNFTFGPQGVLYTAESGVGRVKKYAPDGQYLGLVGYVDTTKFDRGSRLASQSCYIPVEVEKNGKRVYVMDVRANIIRVLVAKE